jgi:hypothetical protein
MTDHARLEAVKEIFSRNGDKRGALEKIAIALYRSESRWQTPDGLAPPLVPRSESRTE